jgi:hypothetical protein
LAALGDRLERAFPLLNLRDTAQEISNLPVRKAGAGFRGLV